MPAALLTAESIRAVEAQAAARGGEPLMARAARVIERRAASLAHGRPGVVVVVAGPGNNGGDAWVAAELLRESSVPVSVWEPLAGEPREAIARAARSRYLSAEGPRCSQLPARVALVVDGLFGIGLTRDLSGDAQAAVEAINASGAAVLAIDIPSGLDADTGAVRGTAVRATQTITFIADKPGLRTGDGLDCAGEVHVETLGLPAEWLEGNAGLLLRAETVPSLPARAANSHKGTFGTVGVVGGAEGMAGAAILAARGALFGGAGKVIAHVLASGTPAFDAAQPEILLGTLANALDADVLVMGPGAGGADSAFAREALPRALQSGKPIILDADALNLVARDADAFRANLRARTAPTLLTPHPGEAARLLGCTTSDVQRDRLSAARRLADQFGGPVALKGAGTVCASADGRWAINTSGNPGLATGGTGDVLAGLLGALMAQGMAPWEAVCLGVWAHGAAADRLVGGGVGPVGLTAGELPQAIRHVLNTHNSLSPANGERP